jgi:anti-sigma B factor antagonist
MMTLARTAVVKLTPQALGAGAIPGVREQLTRIVEGGQQHLYLDLSGVQSVCSIGLGKLVALHRKVQSRGGRLTLFNVNEWIFRILDASRLTQVLEVHRQGKGGSPVADSSCPSAESRP